MEEGTQQCNLGNLFHLLVEFQKARENYDELLAIATDISDRKGEGVL